MKRLLLVNACVNRERSRTLRLARAVVSYFPDHEVEELVLEEMNLRPLGGEDIDRRTELTKNGAFDDKIFTLAHKLAEADIVVIATPFWENCFNSLTKMFMEYSGAVGVAFRYSETGMPIGLCRAKALYYVTTRGGPIPDEGDLGFGIYRSVAQTYGITDVKCISACGLDIVTNDAEAIMQEALSRIPRIVS